MNQPTDGNKVELFRHWAGLGRSPRRIIEDFVASKGLRWDEDVDRLERIVDYALWLSRGGAKK